MKKLFWKYFTLGPKFCTSNHVTLYNLASFRSQCIVLHVLSLYSALGVLIKYYSIPQHIEFNQLQVSMPRKHLFHVTITFDSTQCAYLRRDGQAELAWMA